MTRLGRSRGAGFAPFPRHAALRTNELLPPDVDTVVVHEVLAAHGIPVGDRDTPLGPDVRALVSPTAAGTLVTLEHRTARWVSRRRRLRELDAMVRGVVDDARRAAITAAGTRGQEP